MPRGHPKRVCILRADPQSRGNGSTKSDRMRLGVTFARTFSDEVWLYHARLLPAHFARLRLGARCVLKTKKRVPRAPRPNARLTNPQIADACGTDGLGGEAGAHGVKFCSALHSASATAVCRLKARGSGTVTH
jgi:hypothetical protein